MLVRKAFKYRLYPNQEQQEALAVQFGHARFVYNHFLQARQQHYAESGEGWYYRHTAGMLTQRKQGPKYEWLREADSQVLQQKLKDLDRAYKNFFAGRARYTRFRSRRDKQAMALPVRVWDCPICDTQHDRDINAARNILKQATAGTAGSYADGVQVRPAARLQAGTQKSEAQQLRLKIEGADILK